MTIGPTTIIGFGGDGLPDTDWLGCHARSARHRGENLRADALAWLIREFSRHAVLVPEVPADPDPDPDPDIFPRMNTEAGGYRLFELAAAQEETRTSRMASAQQVVAIRAGQGDTEPTYEAVAREEIHACMGNFLGVPGYAEELDAADWRTRWIDTIPVQVPDDLRDFTAGYLEAMRSFDAVLPPHDEALRRYARSLTVVYASPVANAGAAAGHAHARRTVLFAISTARAGLSGTAAAKAD